MRRSQGWQGWTGVRRTIGGLLAALVLLVLAAPASAAAPVCSNLDLGTVHLGDSTTGQLDCTDADGDPLVYTVQTQPAHSTFADVDRAGFVTYYAPFDYAGADPFTVVVDDQTGNTKTVQVSVEVTDTAPVCQPVDLGKSAHGPDAFLFKQIDCFDADGDSPRAWEIVTQPAHGSADVSFGSLTYDPVDSYVGKDSFTYRVSDGAKWSAPATATVELTNSAPQCVEAGTRTIRQDKPASEQVPCYDPDNDPMQLVVVDQPAHGTISGAPGPFGSLVATYDPDDGFRGTDHLRVRVSDGTLQSDAFDVDLVITRNHAPQCFTDFSTHTKVNTAVLLQTDGVCYDPDYQDSETLTVALDSAKPPQHGALAPSGSNLTYTPATGYSGADAFGIKASDGELTTLATVPLHIANTAFCSPAPTLRVRPGAVKSAFVDCTTPDFSPGSVALVSPPSKGSVTNFFGTSEFRYTANQGASGADSFTFKAGTGALESPVATQDVVVDATANEVPECDDQAPLRAYSGHDAFIFPFCFDADNDALTYTVSRAPSHGTTRKESGFIVYSAAAGYTGADSLDITVTDGHGGSVTIEQPVDVRAPQAPGCGPVQAFTVRPGGGHTVQPFCTNPQGDAQTYSIAQQPGKGTLAAGDFPGIYRYTANPGATGPDHFVLRATNAVGGTDIPVDVTLDEAWNSAPHCASGQATVARGTTTDLPLAARCTDDEGDTFTLARSDQAQHGSVSAGPAAILQYTADPTYTGFDSFTYTATDSRGLTSTPQFFSLNVLDSVAPTCNQQPTITLRPGVSRSLTLSCQDPANAALTYEIVSGPSKGTLQPSGDSTSPFRTYTANAGASGPDSFTYRARSSNGTSTTYTQAFTLDPNANTAPTCSSNSAFPTNVTAGQPRQLFPSCLDTDNDTLTFQAVTQPAHGSVTVANGAMSYTAAAGYTGPDQFTYTANDGHGSTTSPQTMFLQVVAPQPPTCTSPAPMSVRTNSPMRFISIPCQDPQSNLPTIVVEQQPQHGKISEGFGSYYYTPDTGYSGSDSFRYHAQNAAGSSTAVTQAVTVSPDANEAPNCSPFPIKVKPGRSRSLGTVCGDADGDSLTYTITAQPAHGTVSPAQGAGPFTYTAGTGYLGSDSLTMLADDGHGGTRSFTQTITISDTNEAPSCFSGGTISAQSGVATPLPPPPCTDPDGDTLTIEIVGQPTHGAITEQNGTRFYTSNAGYTGPDTFTFRASDGTAQSNIATVNVNVTPPSGPTCQPRSYSVPTDGTLDVDLDCFANGADAVLAIQTPPPASAGSLGPIDQAGDSVRFTPAPDFRGTTSFTFVGSSGGQTSAPATISITVTGHGFAPTVFLSASSTAPRTGAPVTFTASANDPDGGAIAGYQWFVDGAAVAGETTSTLVRSFATAGQHTVKVRVTDDEGDTTERTATITAHTDNQSPQVWLDVPPKVGTGAPVHMDAWAWDPDGTIADYSWDFGDGSPVQSGAGLTEPTHSFATAGTKTVKVTATDNDGAKTVQQATIVVTDANTAPAVELMNWPDPALRSQPAWLFAEISDAENDEVASVKWDLDGDGTYETDGGTNPQRSHTFTTTGDHVVAVRVADARGAVTTKQLTVKVVNAPPVAKIAGPGVLDLNSTGTYTDASTDDGSIASRAWDTDDDGVFDDGTGTSVQVPAGSTTGYKTLRLRVTDNEGQTTTTTRQITVRPAGPVVISDPVAPTLPGGGTVNIGTITDPTSGSTTITLPNGQVGQFPNRCMPLDIGVAIRKAAGATVLNPVLVLGTPGGGTERFPMTDTDGDGIWTAHLDCAVAGTLTVEYTIKAADGTQQSFSIPVGKIVLIDPQGVVYDHAAFEAYKAAHPAASDDDARAATAVAGATVRLQRLVSGAWQDVNASDPGIDPNVNPQVTGANGLYRWDVSDGSYRVRVSAPGFRTKTSNPVVIPPPVLDLHIALDRNPAPVAAITAANEAFRGQTVTFTSDSTDDGAIAAQRWDLDDDGDFDDGTGTVVSRAFTTLGAKTVRLQVTDDEGTKTVVERVVTIVNRLPVASFTAAPTTGFRGDALQFTAQATDADPGTQTFTFAWDTDNDGQFDDGTGATKSVSFDTLGAKTVRVRATDTDGGAGTAQSVVTIVNRNPTATVDGPATGVRGQDLAFTASGVDPDPGPDTLTYAWDADNDGQFDDGTGATKSVAFTTLGAKTVRVQVTDPDAGTVVAQKTVTIQNRAPACDAVSRKTAVGAAVSVPLSCTDADGDAMTLSKASDPAHGTLSAVAGNAVTYTPAAGYFGPDSFTYRANDGTDNSAPATATITVTRPPACDAVTRKTAVGTPVSVPLTCTDADGDALTLSKVTDPAHGTLGSIAANAVTYTPAAGYFGPDSFTYRASDGTAQSAPATASITVTRAPTCAPVSATALSGTATEVTLSCADADGDALTFSKVTDPAHGTLGSVAAGKITYTSTPGYVGPDSFTYKASDGTAQSAPATASITVDPAPNAAPVCAAKSVETPFATAVAVPLTCTDVNGDALTLSIVGQPAHGTLGAITAGKVTYTPAAGYSGADAFTYRASDGKAQSAPATVSLTVKPKPADPGTGGGTTGGGSTGGDGGGGQPVQKDTTAPAATLAAIKGQKLAAVLSKGLKLALTLDEAGTVTVKLTVDKATARKLGLDPKATKAVVVGTLTKAVAAGKTTLTVKLTAKARKALKKAKSVKLGVAVAAKDAAGNIGTKTGSATLKK